jgi:hypothetical protein
MTFSDSVAVIHQKGFAAGKVKRSFLVETGHPCIANSRNIIRKILIYIELHLLPHCFDELQRSSAVRELCIL